MYFNEMQLFTAPSRIDYTNKAFWLEDSFIQFFTKNETQSKREKDNIR